MFALRKFCRVAVIGSCSLLVGTSHVASADAGAVAARPALQEAARLDWLCNAVALTSSGKMFVGLPRWPGYENTPSVGQVLADGSFKAFPGGAWNDWAPGKPTANALVKVNTVHIFDDDTLWVVDQGIDAGPKGRNEGQKILQFDTSTGKLVRNIVLPADVLPAGANLNDLRLDSEYAYLTDSGLGAIIVVNLRTGEAMRRLAGHPSTQMNPERRAIGEGGQPLVKRDGSDLQVHADPIEISPDGQWLYYQPLTGPLWRVPTQGLRDRHLSESALGKQVQLVEKTGALTGTAIDSAGNIYLGEYDKPRVSVLTPDGTERVLVEDERLWNPDAMFITANRELYIPVPQSARMASNRGPGGVSKLVVPFKIYKLQLPAQLGSRQHVPTVAKAPGA